MKLTFRVGDVWTDRGYCQPFTVERIDDCGNVFGRYSTHAGITTRLEYVDRARPVRLVGWWRRLALWLGWAS